MNFSELTRVMLSSMDFFELRRTAARYGVAYQGVRRSKLLRDLEKKITSKSHGAAQDTGKPAELDADIDANDDELDAEEAPVAKSRPGTARGKHAHS